MRVFKLTTIFCLCVYFCALVYVNLAEKKLKYETEHNLESIKLKVLAELDHSNPDRPRIVIFGSSHCDVGLKAEDVTEATGIPTFNLCHAGWGNSEKYLNKIMSHLNSKDYLIYAQRIKFDAKKLKNEKNFIEDFKLTIVPSLFRFKNLGYDFYLSNLDSDYTLSGDRISTKLDNAQGFPDYQINYELINLNLKDQLVEITNKNSKIVRIIIITAPILIRNTNLFMTKKIQVDLTEFENVLAWLPPIITNQKEYFENDKFHLNGAGREVWTAQLINQLKKIVK